MAVLITAACTLAAAPAPALAARVSGDCAPPRTRIVLCPLVDVTDRSWAAWSGAEPASVVSRMLADSLMKARGRDVVLAPASAEARRPVEDALAIELGRRARAEVVVTGVVREFTQEDRREPGKFSRWGVGPPDARSFAEVRVSLRVLDARDGTVILESTVSRERRRRSAASIERSPLASEAVVTPGERPSEQPVAALPGGPLAEALDEVIADLVHSLDKRLDERWQARVVSAAGGVCVLDAGAASGLFTGERLEIWRPGIETYDSDFLRVGEEVRVGVVVVTTFDPSGRAKARVAEGDALPGDRVRPCRPDSTAPVTFRR